jgi:hypothetical protein
MKQKGDKVYVLVNAPKGVVVEEMVITEVVTPESPSSAGLYECENDRIIIRSNGDYVFTNQVEAVYQQSVFLKTNTTTFNTPKFIKNVPGYVLEEALEALRVFGNAYKAWERKTCADRDLVGAYVSIQKVLRGEELTGLERLLGK